MKKILVIAANCVLASAISQTTFDGSLNICRFNPVQSSAPTIVLPNSTQQMRTSVLSNFQNDFAFITPTLELYNARQYINGLWSKTVVSSVPINYVIEFKDFGLAFGPAAKDGLAFTTPALEISFTSAPNQPLKIDNTFYPKALANKLSGKELNSAKKDFTITVNSKPPVPWYFGTDLKCPANNVDYVTTILHEIVHGLGFGSTVKLEDKNNPNSPIVYGLFQAGNQGPLVPMDNFITNTSNVALKSFAVKSTALKSFCTSNALKFKGNNANGKDAASKLFAPTTFSNGATCNHLDPIAYPRGSENSLMKPSSGAGEVIRNIGDLTLGVLQDIGWGVNYTVGIEDELRIVTLTGDNGGYFNENQSITASARFIDNLPTGDYLDNPTWKIEALHSTGKITIATCNGYNWNPNVPTGILPAGYKWLRDFNTGAVQANLVIYGKDRKGWYHEASTRFEINYRPEKPQIRGDYWDPNRGTYSISFYAEGATKYRVVYGQSTNINEITPFREIIETSANSATIRLPYYGKYCVNVRGLNASWNESALGDEKCVEWINYTVNEPFTSIIGTTESMPLKDVIISNKGANQYAVYFATNTEYDRVIKIYNLSGQLVKTQQVDKLEMHTELNLEDYTNGMYIINIALINNEPLYNGKLLVTH